MLTISIDSLFSILEFVCLHIKNNAFFLAYFQNLIMKRLVYSAKVYRKTLEHRAYIFKRRVLIYGKIGTVQRYTKKILEVSKDVNLQKTLAKYVLKINLHVRMIF